MKKSILFVSNYYIPYVSGVTENQKMVAEKLASDGYKVKVITTRHDKNLLRHEIMNGVEVERCSVQLKISKGTVSLPFIKRVIQEAKKYDVVHMHLPMLESGIFSLLINREKLLPMYNCDINLPKSIFNNLIVKIMDIQHKICLKRSSAILVTSKEYAVHSRIADKYADKFIEVACPVKPVTPGTYVKSTKYKIGFCGRIVEEKGIDVLIKAFAQLKKEGMQAELLIGGDYQNVAGGSIYPYLKQYIDEHHITDIMFLGRIKEEDLGAFYSSLDVFTLPSVNSLESFGMVQVEAMMCGTPVVSSDLYGVRKIVQNTGMGEICKRGDVRSLASCIRKVVENRDSYIKSPQFIASIYSTEAFINHIKRFLEG